MDSLKHKLLLRLWSLMIKGKRNITTVPTHKIVIFTDGGCSKRHGGWAFVLQHENGEKIARSGNERSTTNNRMELRAVIEALHEAENESKDCKLDIIVNTDSKYVKEGITKWIEKWKESSNWMTASGRPVKNREIWEELDSVVSRLKPTFEWIKGHNGNAGNEECDEMVQEEIKKLS
jgi:ribonuclease HI